MVSSQTEFVSSYKYYENIGENANRVNRIKSESWRGP